jgi:hypothetical protein
MASYGALVRTITTAEINRVLREGNFTRWSYFVDTRANKVGVIYANDTTFAAYAVDDEPDPKLHPFGREAIKDMVCIYNDELLILDAGDNQLQATVFSDPMLLVDDDFLPSLTDEVLLDWQKFLGEHNVATPRRPSLNLKKPKAVLIALTAVVLIMIILAIYTATLSTGHIH